jgi:hypothetical protein
MVQGIVFLQRRRMRGRRRRRRSVRRAQQALWRPCRSPEHSGVPSDVYGVIVPLLARRVSLRSRNCSSCGGALTRFGSGRCVSAVESSARPADSEELVLVLVALLPGVPLLVPSCVSPSALRGVQGTRNCRVAARAVGAAAVARTAFPLPCGGYGAVYGAFASARGTAARDQCPRSRRVNAGDEVWMCDRDAPQPSADRCADFPLEGSASRAAAIGITLP